MFCSPLYDGPIRELQVKAFNWWLAKWSLHRCNIFCWQAWSVCSLQCRPCCSSMIYWSAVTVFITSLIFCTAPNYLLLMIYSLQAAQLQYLLSKDCVYALVRHCLKTPCSDTMLSVISHWPLVCDVEWWPGVMRDKFGDKWHISSVTWQHDTSSHR